MRLHLFAFLAVFLIAAMPAVAADTDASRVSRPMTAIDSVTLRGDDGSTVTLWGVRPAVETAVQADALEYLDKMTGAGPVSCKTVSEAMARCAAATGEDLGLALLTQGYVVTDRHQDVSSVPAYLDAQRAARQSGAGLWHRAGGMKADAGLPSFWSLLCSALPVLAVLLMALVMHVRLRRIETLQAEALETTERKEGQLLARERHVLASTLEGELTENKNRIEAFLTIYGAMLESLKSPTGTPTYQQAGDIVQRYPLLSKAVFEGSVGKLSLLDIALAAQISKLYAAMPKEQEYVNIAPSEPASSVIALLEKVMAEAQAMMGPITAAIQALDGVMASRKTDS